MGKRTFTVTCRVMLSPAAERALASAGFLMSKGGTTTPGSQHHRYHLLEVPAESESEALEEVRSILEGAGATGYELEVTGEEQ